MKIILDDFTFEGHHFERFECDLPQVKNLEEITEELLVEYVIWDLLDFINFNESFYVQERDL